MTNSTQQADDGGPAFPEKSIENKIGPAGYGTVSQPAYARGMTLRDYFAAKAMQALIGHGAELRLHTPKGTLIVPAREAIPELAYEYADGMLAARKAK